METSEERSPSKQVRVISHQEFLDMLDNVVQRILTEIHFGKIKPFKGIYGVPRGGLIPAVYLSHRLDVPLVRTLDAVLSDSHGPYLIVEDVVDTGKTLGRLSMFLTEEDKIVALVVKPWAPRKPDFTACETTDWVSFEWEVERTI